MNDSAGLTLSREQPVLRSTFREDSGAVTGFGGSGGKAPRGGDHSTRSDDADGENDDRVVAC